MLAVAVGVLGGVGGVASQAQAQHTPPGFLKAIETSCLYCSLRYSMDVAGCEDDGSLDQDAETCRAWAYRELRECLRTCWDEDHLPLLLFGLWQRDEITSDQLVELLTD